MGFPHPWRIRIASITSTDGQQNCNNQLLSLNSEVVVFFLSIIYFVLSYSSSFFFLYLFILSLSFFLFLIIFLLLHKWCFYSFFISTEITYTSFPLQTNCSSISPTYIQIFMNTHSPGSFHSNLPKGSSNKNLSYLLLQGQVITYWFTTIFSVPSLQLYLILIYCNLLFQIFPEFPLF